MTKYVIYKSSRSPAKESYGGPSWDAAGIRDKYRAQYSDRAEAKHLADALTEVNGVGFQVARIS